MKVISPASTQATSSLSRWRWKRLLVPAGRVSSQSMRPPLVPRPRRFKAAKPPGAPLSRCVAPASGEQVRPRALMSVLRLPPWGAHAALPSSDQCWSDPGRRSGARPLADPLMEAPAVALGVERLVGAMASIAPEVVAEPGGDPCPGGGGTLIVRIDVVDVHADVLALDAGSLRAHRAMVALRADPDHAAAELERRMAHC